jgi:hypothetical protein
LDGADVVATARGRGGDVAAASAVVVRADVVTAGSRRCGAVAGAACTVVNAAVVVAAGSWRCPAVAATAGAAANAAGVVAGTRECGGIARSLVLVLVSTLQSRQEGRDC